MNTLKQKTMNKIVVTIILIASCNVLFSQNPTGSELLEFNKSRNKKSKIGLQILGGWALANMGASAFLYTKADGVDKSFHEMNVMWNGVNAIIVGTGLLPKEKNDINLSKTLKWQSNTEAIYIANAAIDLVYCTSGLYLTEKAKTSTKYQDKFKGWGNSLAYNGGFLFILDTGMFIAHKRNGKKLSGMMDKINITTGLTSIKISVHI